jgi:hypothetical protein
VRGHHVEWSTYPSVLAALSIKFSSIVLSLRHSAESHGRELTTLLCRGALDRRRCEHLHTKTGRHEGRRPASEQLRGLIRECLNNVNLSMCWGRCDMKTFAINEVLRRNPTKFSDLHTKPCARFGHSMRGSVEERSCTEDLDVFDPARHRPKPKLPTYTAALAAADTAALGSRSRLGRSVGCSPEIRIHTSTKFALKDANWFNLRPVVGRK